MAGVYRPRHPERTGLYRVLFHSFDRFLVEYESRFEKEYGYFPPIIKEVVERYLDCGNPKCGFARIRCRDCGREFLLHFFFVADKPPPPRIAYQEILMAVETSAEYIS